MKGGLHWDEKRLIEFQKRIGASKGRVVRLLDETPEKEGPKPTTSKYKNRKVQTEEASFASEKEHRRYLALKAMEQAGRIKNLKLQVRFVLAEGYEYNGRRVPPLRYFADFQYEQDGQKIAEDCKGYKTRVYEIKRHLMFTVHGVRILET